MTDRSLRLSAGRALASALGRSEVRELFKHNGHQSGEPIILALDDDSVESVCDRAGDDSKRVTVAIYNPSDESVKFMSIEPGDPKAAVAAMMAGREPINGAASIGMLYAYLASRPFRPVETIAIRRSARLRVAAFAS